MQKIYLYFVVFALVGVACGYLYGEARFSAGKDTGYRSGYEVGYKAGYEERNRLDLVKVSDAVTGAVKTETQVIYRPVPYTGSDVKIETPPPVVSVEVNGKKHEFEQKSSTADIAVKTETAVKIKIPERRWKFGVGTDGKNVAGMLSFPVKGAVGGWVAGTRGKVMGGVSISF